jgi:hypothetical protein
MYVFSVRGTKRKYPQKNKMQKTNNNIWYPKIKINNSGHAPNKQ